MQSREFERLALRMSVDNRAARRLRAALTRKARSEPRQAVAASDQVRDAIERSKAQR